MGILIGLLQLADRPDLALPDLPGPDPARQGGRAGRCLRRRRRLERLRHQGGRRLHPGHDRHRRRSGSSLSHAPGRPLRTSGRPRPGATSPRASVDQGAPPGRRRRPRAPAQGVDLAVDEAHADPHADVPAAPVERAGHPERPRPARARTGREDPLTTPATPTRPASPMIAGHGVRPPSPRALRAVSSPRSSTSRRGRPCS